MTTSSVSIHKISGIFSSGKDIFESHDFNRDLIVEKCKENKLVSWLVQELCKK